MMENEKFESGQYFTFRLGTEVYAIDIRKVKEVLEVLKITHVPQSADFKLGVINLRGTIVPIIDLHRKFNLPGYEETINSSIIIVQTVIDDETVTIGSIVDEVEEVIRLEPKRIDDTLKLGSQLKANYISSIGKKGDDFIIILDVENIFSREELLEIEQ